MAQAVASFAPQGLSRNRQIAAALLRKKRYGLLTLLYLIKNLGRS